MNRPVSPFAISRRGFLFATASLAVPSMAGCKCGGQTGDVAADASDPQRRFLNDTDTSGPVVPPWQTLSFEPSAIYPEEERALVRVPDGAKDLPVVVALHGRGETRSLDIGARGFRDFYGLDRVAHRLRAPPIKSEDLLGFSTQERLAQINASLASEPYRGVVLACPYAPDLRDRSFEGAKPFGRFVTEVLLPKARSVSGATASAERTGIDGVSMGGRLALWIGFQFPELFGAVGAMQPALRADEAPAVASLAQAAREKNPKMRIRLLSSEDDPFLPAVRALSEKMRQTGVEHDLVVVPGPHNYEWNRGPGCTEMLLWQERALRGLAAP